ncbi:MAG: response regulator [Sedimentisphaerales bacterium]|nr:response regulator [Sedimentisphaerales bacterium]
MKSCRPVLLVEDDNVDAMTVRRAFKELNITNPVVRAVNGEEALDYLRAKGDKKPCVVLLDLNMPKMNGAEFLKAAKADESIKDIPVVVLTTSKEQYDIQESFKNGVAGYIVKPVDYKNFVEAVRTIKLYWTLSELPDGN